MIYLDRNASNKETHISHQCAHHAIPASKPEAPANDKENEVPRDSASHVDLTPRKAPEKKTGRKSGAKDSKTKGNGNLPDNYLDIDLEEKKGEVPCYEMYVVVIQPFDKY